MTALPELPAGPDDGSARRPSPEVGGLPAIAPDATEPQPPPTLAVEDADALAERARAIVTELEEARGSKELALIDALAGLGTQAQREAGASLALLRGRLGDMMAREGAGGKVAGGTVARELVELRVALLQIDPTELGKPGVLRRILAFLPFVGPSNPPFRVLERIAARYDVVAGQVQAVEGRLSEGRRLLIRDNIELRQLYEGVEAQQAPVERAIYLGERLMGELSAMLERAADPNRAERVRSVLHDVTMRVQDLRTMQAAYAQFYVSIEMTRQNNSRLAQSVERTVSMAANVLMVGLAIQAALLRQERVLEATRRTQEFLGRVLASNAAAIHRHTVEIGDIYNCPVIALEQIAQAHHDLLEAMATVDRYKQDGIRVARENIARLARLTEEMQGKLATLQAGPDDGQRALEA
jgi:uncharacterized protein YaaN involved in tellurite resistance